MPEIPKPALLSGAPSPSSRLVSLDAFRGLTIVGMLWVNNQQFAESTLHQFGHAHFGEFPTFTDMIFPWFLFIIGCAMPFSWASRAAKGFSKRWFYVKSVQRAITLFLLGCIIDSTLQKRISVSIGGGVGVLQLIALSYFLAVFLYALRPAWRIGVIVLILAGYWAAIRYIDVPGIGRGVFEEERNLITWLNQQFLGPWHLRGLISAFPAAAEVLIGTLIGDMLRVETESRTNKLRYMVFAGAVLTLIGLGWHMSIAMTKHFWTPSYILFTAGIGLFVLSLFFWLMDVVGARKWAFFFVVYGMNAISAYFISIMVREHTLKEWFWNPTAPAEKRITLWNAAVSWFSSHFGHMYGGWLFTGSYIVCWWFVLLWMYKKRVFWRV